MTANNTHFINGILKRLNKLKDSKGHKLPNLRNVNERAADLAWHLFTSGELDYKKSTRMSGRDIRARGWSAHDPSSALKRLVEAKIIQNLGGRPAKLKLNYWTNNKAILDEIAAARGLSNPGEVAPPKPKKSKKKASKQKPAPEPIQPEVLPRLEYTQMQSSLREVAAVIDNLTSHSVTICPDGTVTFNPVKQEG